MALLDQRGSRAPQTPQLAELTPSHTLCPPPWQNPVAVNPWRLFTEYTTGKSSIAECIEFNEKLPVKIILVPRPGRGRPAGAQLLHAYQQPTCNLLVGCQHIMCGGGGGGATAASLQYCKSRQPLRTPTVL